MVETIIFDYMSPHCDLDFEDSKPIFLHNAQAHDDAIAIPSLVTKGSALIIQMNIHWISEPFLCPWHWPQQSNPIFSQDNPACDDGQSKPSLVAQGSAVQKIKKKSEAELTVSILLISCELWRYIRKWYFGYMIFHCDLHPEDSKPILKGDNLTHDDASLY